METKIEKQLRFLKAYIVVSSLVFGVFIGAASALITLATTDHKVFMKISAADC